MTTRQLTALLALPAAVRPQLYAATVSSRGHGFRASPSRLATFSTTAGALASAARHMKTAAFSIPEYSTSPPLGLTPAQLFEHSSLPSANEDNLEDALSTLFTKNPATFYYGNPDFYHLRKNTRTPEVCILGRSNVGKSSLVNAVANRMGSELARVSKKAGHTKTINAYGFGPAPRPEKGEVAVGPEFKGKEEMPKHMFFLVDMPGYGHGSLQEWGKNIALYLQKRTALKGAVMLIDAEVGPKDSDWTAIELMANAGLRPAIVLTKADKVKNGQEGLSKTCKTVWEGIRRIEAQLAESNKKWTWEKEFYVTATGATDAAVRRATITTARLVVARLAGLIKDTRPEAATNQKWSGKIVSFDELFGHSSADPAETSAAEPDLQQDDIQVKQDEWDEVEDVEDEGVNVEKESEANAALESRMHNHRHREPTPPRRSSNNTARESPRWKVTGSRTTRPGPMSRHGGSKKPASKAKGRSTPTHAPKVVPTDPLSRMQAASRPVLGSRTQRPPKASFFHTTSCSRHAQSAPPAPSNQSQTPPQPHPLTKEELGAVLSDFITTLQPSTTLRDLVRQRKLDMETGVGQPTPEELSQSWADRLEANKQALARRHWRGTRRIREVRDRRLAHEEDKLRRQEAMLAEQARLEKDTDWVAIRREMRAMEREKKAEEARLLAALEESQRGLEEYADEHGEKPAEEEYGEGEGADEEIDLSARAGARRGRRGGKVDEFERVFASKLGGSGGGGGKSDKGGKSKSARPSF